MTMARLQKKILLHNANRDSMWIQMGPGITPMAERSAKFIT